MEQEVSVEKMSEVPSLEIESCQSSSRKTEENDNSTKDATSKSKVIYQKKMIRNVGNTFPKFKDGNLKIKIN